MEALGMDRARAAIRAADLAVLVIPAGASDEDARRWESEAAGRPLLRVASKADAQRSSSNLAVSAKTGAGVGALSSAVAARLYDGLAHAPAATADRHLEALRRADESLERASAALEGGTLEIVAGEVGLAMGALAEITGEDASEALLDGIFQRFCIGK